MSLICQLLMCLGAMVIYALVIGLLTFFFAWLSLRKESYSHDDEDYLLIVITIQALIAMFFIADKIVHI